MTYNEERLKSSLKPQKVQIIRRPINRDLFCNMASKVTRLSPVISDSLKELSIIDMDQVNNDKPASDNHKSK